MPPMGEDERVTRGMKSRPPTGRRAAATGRSAGSSASARPARWRGWGSTGRWSATCSRQPPGVGSRRRHLELGQPGARAGDRRPCRRGRRIAALGAAIELVDPDPKASDPEAILETDIFQRHVLLGPVTPVTEGASLTTSRCRSASTASRRPRRTTSPRRRASSTASWRTSPRRLRRPGVARAGRHGDLRVDRHGTRDRAG